MKYFKIQNNEEQYNEHYRYKTPVYLSLTPFSSLPPLKQSLILRGLYFLLIVLYLYYVLTHFQYTALFSMF